VADHGGLAELEIEYVAGVDSRVDTPDDAQRLAGREPNAGERAAGREVGIPSNELVDRDGHGRRRPGVSFHSCFLLMHQAIFSRWLRPRASTACAWTGATSSLALSPPNAAPTTVRAARLPLD